MLPNIPDEKEDNVVRNYVEQMPEFPGGLSALMLWLSKHLEYPKEAVRNGLEGKVITQFTVEKDGSVTNVKVIRDGVGGGAFQRGDCRTAIAHVGIAHAVVQRARQIAHIIVGVCHRRIDRRDRSRPVPTVFT